MNTYIHYMYRDGSNYKWGQEYVLAGHLTDEQKTEITMKCQSGEYFLAAQVGLKELQPRYLESYPCEDDHPRHELNQISDTESPPTTDLTAWRLYISFMAVKSWDEDAAIKRLGLPNAY